MPQIGVVCVSFRVNEAPVGEFSFAVLVMVFAESCAVFGVMVIENNSWRILDLE